MTEKVIVSVKEGKVRGFKSKTAYSGAEYYTFLGVPYGQSTAGSARFKDPVKVKPWTHILDATVEKGGCRQFAIWKQETIGSEDCLYNNIYTPKIPSKGDPLKAVIVFIHPGGLTNGSPDPSYFGAPHYIMHKEVVYVCVAYRLHILGFLNLHLKTCSGNQGLKDIILSLQWIKENISSFGGDPDNVTLMGCSSGCALVHFLLLSPLAKGLYHKAVLMGVYAFCPVTVVPPENASIAHKLAQSIGYDGQPGENKKLLRFYKNLDSFGFLMKRPESFFEETTIQVYPVSPFVLTSEPGENSPIPLSPEKLIPSTNRVPLLIGFCEKEAIMGVAQLRHSGAFKPLVRNTFYKAIRQNHFGWGAALEEEELKLIQKEVENFYLAGNAIETVTESVLCDILTDAALSDVYDSLINEISTDLPSSVFVYNFLYDGNMCVMKPRMTRLLGKELPGACHATENCYWSYIDENIGGKNINRIQPKDRQMIETFTSMLTTFAKNSNPNYKEMEVEWKPTNPDHPSHLIIDEKLEVKDGLLNGDRMEFWHKLKNQFQKDGKNLHTKCRAAVVNGSILGDKEPEISN
ncbi:esterase E4-like [Planococcus citri]|uniref:esterase E4-like n=1 Tax=Planococcus citri TaxID=170843 RepID=UPI0031F77422